MFSAFRAPRVIRAAILVARSGAASAVRIVSMRSGSAQEKRGGARNPLEQARAEIVRRERAR